MSKPVKRKRISRRETNHEAAVIICSRWPTVAKVEALRRLFAQSKREQ